MNKRTRYLRVVQELLDYIFTLIRFGNFENQDLYNRIKRIYSSISNINNDDINFIKSYIESREFRSITDKELLIQECNELKEINKITK